MRALVREARGRRAPLLNRLADDEDVAHRKRHPEAEITRAAASEGSSRPQAGVVHAFQPHADRQSLAPITRRPGEAAREDHPFAPEPRQRGVSVHDTAADVAPTCSSASPIPSASSAISARSQTSGGDTAMPFASGRTSTPA